VLIYIYTKRMPGIRRCSVNRAAKPDPILILINDEKDENGNALAKKPSKWPQKNLKFKTLTHINNPILPL